MSSRFCNSGLGLSFQCSQPMLLGWCHMSSCRCHSTSLWYRASTFLNHLSPAWNVGSRKCVCESLRLELLSAAGVFERSLSTFIGKWRTLLWWDLIGKINEIQKAKRSNLWKEKYCWMFYWQIRSKSVKLWLWKVWLWLTWLTAAISCQRWYLQAGQPHVSSLHPLFSPPKMVFSWWSLHPYWFSCLCPNSWGGCQNPFFVQKGCNPTALCGGSAPRQVSVCWGQ